MEKLEQTINTFVLLGKFIDQFLTETHAGDQRLNEVNQLHYESFGRLIKDVQWYNPWFTEEFVLEALRGVRQLIEKEHLEQWFRNYPELEKRNMPVKSVGVVMAGNIPLVGFHDFLSTLVTGNRIIIKTSSKDEHLIKAVAEVVKTINPALADKIVFPETPLTGIDAVIATGSSNTSRYFEYYFRNIPSIIRKNRNSIAVLTGTESDSQLKDLGRDIFTYFGLGCRNVTKLFVPKSYDPSGLLSLYESYNYLYHHHKYANNIDYYRTIYVMNGIPFLDNGAFLLKEDRGLSGPVGVVYYEKYSDIEQLRQYVSIQRDQLQCVVSAKPFMEGVIPPGSTQKPLPWDYADGVDTLRFLIDN
ncbi:MAG: hypothetical protein JXR52_02885 [Bacteroidales bacterium]|nr:hypothetical protein [Bacteroidales bacterium]MBN2697745.1 hypothetical protein [Bacteroidales bacterium]